MIFGIDLAHAHGVEIGWQERLYLGDTRFDLLQGDVDLTLEIEFD